MRRPGTTAAGPPRRGMALIWTAVVLALLAAVLGGVGAQVLANRRAVERRQQKVQALWLARSGVELAVARLLTDPADYRGETVESIPRSQVRIVVRAEPEGYEVVSEASFPIGEKAPATQSITRRFRRVVDNVHVRLEALPPAPAKTPGAGPQR